MKKEKGSSLSLAIQEWIRQQVKQARARGIVVGLSGGIDSAVVAVLAQKAVGKNVLGVMMPCQNLPQDARDARELADCFGIRTTQITLDSVYRAFLRLLPKGSHNAMANIKPRLRMITLYYLAGVKGYLVAGTGNKSELSVGYFTKYGDGGVDLLPIGGLYKTQVWQLARELEIPEKFIRKVPSAGLWKGQTDEGEMGVLYAELDKYLFEKENEKEKCSVAKRIALRVGRLIQKSEHKRKPVPVFQSCPSFQSQ